MKLRSFCCLVLMLLTSIEAGADETNNGDPAKKYQWDLAKLNSPPDHRWLESHGQIRSLIYTGEKFNGKPTEVFAYYASPSTLSGKNPEEDAYPGIVLLHGGGGTAFAEWVHRWAKRGYAAIAMDLGGERPLSMEYSAATGQRSRPKRQRLPAGGPADNHPEKFGNVGEDREDDWQFHAVSNAIRAHSLIRSFPEVNANRTAVTGISWGGYLTCLTASIDHRFKAAVPVYGCGFLHDGESVQRKAIDALPDQKRQLWVDLYDPSSWLGECQTPIMFVNGVNDQHYPLLSYSKTYQLVECEKQIQLDPMMGHSHRSGWAPPEIGLFIDQHVLDATPLPKVSLLQRKEKNLVATVESTTDIVEAKLHFTIDLGVQTKRRWKSIPAASQDGQVTATLPANTVAYFFSVKDERNAFVSSNVAFLNAPVVDPREARSSTSSFAPRKPNIIVIYTDDQGYGDVSALNVDAKFKTPNMDRLAREGIVFSNGHSADSICTPSRYALLTGRYPWRTRMKRGVLGAEAECLISDQQLTIPSMLKAQGYNTAMVGKWHLGMDFPGTPGNRDWSQPIRDMPLDKGFDYYFGIPASLNYGILAWFEGRHATVPPTLFTNKKTNPRHSDYRIMPPYDQSPQKTKQRLKKVGWEVAPDFVDNQCLTRFTDKAISWLENQVEETKGGRPFFLYLPYTSPHFPVCPLPEFHGQGQCGAYGEFLIETDYHIGRILKFLKDNNLDEDTLIVFSSDNGPEKPWKAHLDEYKHDSRGGFREGKRSVYEGGHRVPFLVRWPKGIVSPGRTWTAPVGQVDLLATFAEITGFTLPPTAGVDSHSFASVLNNPQSDYQRVPLVVHGNPECRYSIIEANWKLVMPSKRSPKTELYDLSTDTSEQLNISAKHTELVKQLRGKLIQVIASGRSTPGVAQPNDTPYWEELSWMTPEEYEQVSNR